MNAEEQLFEEYAYLVPITLHKMYDSPKNIAKSKHLEYDDLLQFGRYGLMDACRSWESKKLGSFRNFCIRNIKWSVGSHLLRESINHSLYKNTNFKRKDENVKLTVLSMNNKPSQDAGEDTSFNDIISTDNINETSYHQSVETKVFSNITYDEIMKLLNDTEKDMVLMKMNNATFQQIADKYGVTRQRIGIVFNKIRGKVNRHMGVVTN